MKRIKKTKRMLFTRVFFCTSSLICLSNSTGNTNDSFETSPEVEKTRNPFAFRNNSSRKYLGQGFIDIEGSPRKNIIIYEQPDTSIEHVEFVK